MSKRSRLKSIALHSAYKAGVFEMGRFARRDMILILCYHRFCVDHCLPGATPLKLFELHVRYLRKRFNPISFKDAEAMKRGALSISHPVILTVDDGYCDFIDKALPVLRKYNFPATLFVTTRFLDGEIWLWPDIISHCIQETNQRNLLISDLALSLPLHSVEQRNAGRAHLHEFYKKLSRPAQEHFLNELPKRLKVPLPASPTAEFAPMTWSQLREAPRELVEIGSHTLNHHILSSLDSNQAKGEVEQSKKRIEAALEEPVIAFSYPNGKQEDYRESDKANIKRCGYLFAVTCNSGFNSLASDALELNRVVASAELPIFAKEVSGFELIIHKNSSDIKCSAVTRSIIPPPFTSDVCADDAKEKWDAFVDAMPDASIFLRYDWKHVFEKSYGNKCFYLLVKEKQAVVGILPLVLKRSRMFGTFLVSLPYFDTAGLCAHREDVRGMLLLKAAEFGKQTNAKYIELRHNRELCSELPSRQQKVSLMLELPSDSDRLWDDLKAKVRNQVRKAQKEKLTAVSGQSELLDDFFSVYSHNMRDLGSPSHHKEFFRHICQFFPEAVQIFCVQEEGKTLAAAFTIASRDILHVPWASALREFNAKCPNMFLYWSMLEYACRHGFHRFCFGRSNPGEGTYNFKRQWGAYPIQLYWQYWLAGSGSLPNLNMTNSKYSLPVKLWKNLPVAVTRRLGPHVIQNLA